MTKLLDMKLAVYGTLRRGGPANGYLRGARFVREASVLGSIYDLGPFPGFKGLSANGNPVVVDIYDIPTEELLNDIDRYEGYLKGKPDESLYTRKRVLTCDRVQEWVSIYEYNGKVSHEAKIASGDWFKA